jgi:hypothetical protein
MVSAARAAKPPLSPRSAGAGPGLFGVLDGQDAVADRQLLLDRSCISARLDSLATISK